MAYLAIERFGAGIDRRRSCEMGAPGALFELRNAHITAGGEIERCRKWVKSFDLPPSCFGLVWARGGLWSFGSDGAPTDLPPGVSYFRLAHPYGARMTALVDVERFSGKFYVIADFDNGDTVHFFDGAVVSAIWNGQGQFAPSLGNVVLKLAGLLRDAGWLATAATSAGEASISIEGEIGQAFAASAFVEKDGARGGLAATVTTVQAASAPVGGLAATARLQVAGDANGALTDLQVNGLPLIRSAVRGHANPREWAQAIVDAIDVGHSGYRATRDGALVTLIAPIGVGAAINGVLPAIRQIGGALSAPGAFTGGVSGEGGAAQRADIALTGGFDVNAAWRIVIDGVVFGPVSGRGGSPRIACTHDDKLYIASGGLLSFSKIADPTVFHPHENGAGFVAIANHYGGFEDVTGLAAFGRSLAVFTQSAIQLWQTDPDPARTIRLQTLANTGALAERSVESYQDADIFYLSRQGIRSFKPRGDTPLGDVEEIGAPIDALVTEYLAGLSAGQIAKAQSIVEPVAGRYWLAVGSRVFALSYYRASKISAWSSYDLPFSVERFVAAGRRFYALGQDRGVYLYGGPSGREWSDEPVAAQTPFMTLGRPATLKTLTGVDIVAPAGEWDVAIAIDPDCPQFLAQARGLRGVTASRPNVPLTGANSHVALRLTCSAQGAARLASIILHFDLQEAE